MRAGQPARILPSARCLPQRSEIVRTIRLSEARHSRTTKQSSRWRNSDHTKYAPCVRGSHRSIRKLSSSISLGANYGGGGGRGGGGRAGTFPFGEAHGGHRETGGSVSARR